MLTINDIFTDIEFELIQGTIPRNELGQSIEAVKKHHYAMRAEILQMTKPNSEARDIASRQFQINEMLLTLLQEMATTMRALQFQHQQLSANKPKEETNLPLAASAQIPANENDSGSDNKTVVIRDNELYWWPPLEVEKAMQTEAIQVNLEARPINIPLLGGWLTRLRTGVHQLVLFYLNRLVGKQAKVNQTYGDWMLHLMQLHQFQEEKIADLERQLLALKNQPK